MFRERMDILYIAALVVIVGIGLLSVFSASRAVTSEPVFPKQVAWVLAGSLGFLFTARVNLRVIEELAYMIYGAACLLLILTALIGSGPAGRWLAAGPLRFQASELAKVATIIAAARAFADLEARPRKYGHFLVFAGFVPAFLLTWAQPDLGTAAAMLLILLMMTWWAGYGPDWIFLLVSPVFAALSSMRLAYWAAFTAVLVLILIKRRAGLGIWVLILAGNTLVAALTPVAWGLLRPYQQERLSTFLNPSSDPQGAGWNVIQSEVAIGSGGLWGRGYLEGTQKGLAFLPARHTDFAFSVWAEETGFAGAMLLLAAFGVLLFRLLRAASRCASPFYSLLAAGTASYFAVHLAVNIGMTVGIMPVTGIPLVLVSYGGSQTAMALILAGLGLNAAVNWKVF
ncbi:rod shape-determining protein RodA [Candidatus Fermentibacteria bacterium]|nr:rod shape-determining protein RodA [Candidatus Fermentibacteria bacterium]